MLEKNYGNTMYQYMNCEKLQASTLIMYSNLADLLELKRRIKKLNGQSERLVKQKWGEAMNSKIKETQTDSLESLEKLFAGFDTDRYSKKNKNEYDWGKPQGREIW